jgi:hypothetical protein
MLGLYENRNEFTLRPLVQNLKTKFNLNHSNRLKARTNGYSLQLAVHFIHYMESES